MSDLPPCPFCGKPPLEDHEDNTCICYTDGCVLNESWVSISLWPRLSLPKEYTQAYTQFELSLKAERERAERAEKENESVRSIIAMMDYAALRGTLDNIRVALGMEKSASDDYILAQIDKGILADGSINSKIERIKKYRQLTDSSLADSKIFIEKHYSDNGFGKRL